MHKLLTATSFLITTIISCNNKDEDQALYTSKELTPVNSFTKGAEGPAIDKDGNLYAVNYSKEGTVGEINLTGNSSVFIELPDSSVGNGIRFNSKGEMFIADYTKHNILKVNIATKEISVYAHDSLMSQPNDLAIDDKDRLYASDPNWKNNTGRIWRAGADGKMILLEDNMGTANGIEVSPDNKTLYVNESVQKNVWAYDLSDRGTISNKRLLIQFSDFGMDGMRCDADGNLYIARYGKGVISEVSPEGKLIREIKLIGKNCSNICFGGKDGKTAYVTLQDKGNIETFNVEVAGREWKMMHKN